LGDKTTTGKPSSISLGMERSPMFAASATSRIVPSFGDSGGEVARLAGVRLTTAFFTVIFLVLLFRKKKERRETMVQVEHVFFSAQNFRWRTTVTNRLLSGGE
jgi:hypothetical protein